MRHLRRPLQRCLQRNRLVLWRPPVSTNAAQFGSPLFSCSAWPVALRAAAAALEVRTPACSGHSALQRRRGALQARRGPHHHRHGLAGRERSHPLLCSLRAQRVPQHPLSVRPACIVCAEKPWSILAQSSTLAPPRSVAREMLRRVSAETAPACLPALSAAQSARVLSATPGGVCRGVVGKKTALENLDLVLITIDETVDDGCALCCGAVLCLPCDWAMAHYNKQTALRSARGAATQGCTEAAWGGGIASTGARCNEGGAVQGHPRSGRSGDCTARDHAQPVSARRDCVPRGAHLCACIGLHACAVHAHAHTTCSSQIPLSMRLECGQRCPAWRAAANRYRCHAELHLLHGVCKRPATGDAISAECLRGSRRAGNSRVYQCVAHRRVAVAGRLAVAAGAAERLRRARPAGSWWRCAHVDNGVRH